ncbi:hypothetical protein P3W45_000218 [Vairimorpha bombi]|jgi:hypothetical protein
MTRSTKNQIQKPDETFSNETSSDKTKGFMENDFLPLLDNSPFILYILLSILSLFGTLVYNAQCFIFGLVPLSYANLVGCYHTEKFILYVLDGTYLVYLMIFYKTLRFY